MRNKVFILIFALLLSSASMYAYVFIDNFAYELDETSSTAELSYIINNRYVGDVIIPESIVYEEKTYTVTSIGFNAFIWSSDMTSITIPNSIINIEDGAFWGCSSLTSITIPNGVINIGLDAFWGCAELTTITIPNSVITIGHGAFNGCAKLVSIAIPASVSSIGDYAFYYCYSLSAINVAADNSIYCSKNGVLFTKDMTKMVAYPGGKQGDYKIPNSVTSIEVGTFFECRALTAITIPNTISSIGSSAFTNCKGLVSVVCETTIPPTIGDSIFCRVDCSQIPLYVPAGSVDAYKTADQWKDFNPILPISSQAVTNVLEKQTANSRKFLRDGQVLILRGDKTYTVQGQEVK